MRRRILSRWLLLAALMLVLWSALSGLAAANVVPVSGAGEMIVASEPR